jgi:hypothetical protein
MLDVFLGNLSREKIIFVAHLKIIYYLIIRIAKIQSLNQDILVVIPEETATAKTKYESAFQTINIDYIKLRLKIKYIWHNVCIIFIFIFF